MEPIIDTHLHLWDLKEFKIPWLEGVDALNSDHSLEDYLRACGNYSPEAMIYMEVDVSANQKLKEAETLVSMIQSSKNRIRACVCSGVLGEPGFDELLDSYRHFSEVRGIRHVLHVPEYAPGHCLRPEFIEDLHKVFEAGLLFDICIRPSELEDAITLADRFPQGIFILDHCGNPDPLLVCGKKNESENSKENPFWHRVEDWKKQIARLGEKENVICKISGIIARADPDNFHSEDLKPTVDHCIRCFGEDRIIFGGDWPVCNLTLGLETWIDALKEILSGYPESLRRKLFADNARRIYRV